MGDTEGGTALELQGDRKRILYVPYMRYIIILAFTPDRSSSTIKPWPLLPRS